MKLRKRNVVSYYEPKEPSFDDYIYCDKCEDYVYEYCSIHGALLVIPDDDVTFHSSQRVPRAALTIPKEFLHIAPSIIPGAGLGVFATLTLPKGVRFGPYSGRILKDMASSYCWQIYDEDRKTTKVVDASDSEISNWMRYVNCARHFLEQNLVAYQYHGQIYYRTIKIIPRFTELMVFYGGEFAQLLGINLRHYNTDEYYFKIHAEAAMRNALSNNQVTTVNTHTNKPASSNQLKPFQVGTIDDFVLIDEEDVDFDNTFTEEDSVNNDFDYSRQYNADAENIESIGSSDKLTCEYCGKTFRSNYNLKRHKMAVHGVNCNATKNEESNRETGSSKDISFATFKEHTCDICFKTLSSNRCFKRHMREIHGENVDSNCNTEILSQNRIKTDNTVQYLKNNDKIDTYTGTLATDKEKTCDVCFKSFSRIRNLKHHKKYIHGDDVYIRNGVQYFKCDACNKYFLNKRTLYFHCLKEHPTLLSENYPIACNLCSFRTTCNNYLVRHMRVVHKIKARTNFML